MYPLPPPPYIYIYIYIYIVIHRQTVSLYHNSSVWLKKLDYRSDSTTQPPGYQRKRRKFKRLCITFVLFTYICLTIYIYMYIYIYIYMYTNMNMYVYTYKICMNTNKFFLKVGTSYALVLHRNNEEHDFRLKGAKIMKYMPNTKKRLAIESAVILLIESTK